MHMSNFTHDFKWFAKAFYKIASSFIGFFKKAK